MRVLGWNESFAKRTLKGYRQFMELKSVMKKLVETDVESSQPQESSSQPLKPTEPSSELPKTAELSAELPKPAELSSELANLFSGELPSVSELQLLLPGVIQV